MRTILGPPATALGRRGLALERAAMVTLRRDAYAVPPGPTLGLAIGERTAYRPGAWLLDTFERAALGDTYAAWGGAAGLTLEAGGVTVAVGPGGMVTHPRALPRDAWAAIQIGALAGDAEVGLLLRAATDTADGYWITATPTQTSVAGLAAGVPTGLASVATPWRAGQMLRAVWAWDALGVYQDTILVAQVTDATRLLAGLAGFTARRGDAGAAAVITAFLGGEARQEWLGAGLDLGDLQRVLGQPMTFDLTLSNLAPMGGAARFTALLRHGGNPAGAYDLDRGTVRVLTVIDGGSPPLTAGLGVIDGATEVTEDRVRVACRGHDAFLTPRLAAGPVTYLPGPPPGGLTPLPGDPCAPSTPPVIVPGAVPAEPSWPEPPAAGGAGGLGDAVPVEGLGPEAPPGPGDGGLVALMGAWLVTMTYERTGFIYTGSTTATPLPTVPPPDWFPTATARDRWRIITSLQVGTGDEDFPQFLTVTMLYRGPDLTGSALKRGTYGDIVAASCLAPGAQVALVVGCTSFTAPPNRGVTLKLADYTAAGIHTEADLTALAPRNPEDLGAWNQFRTRLDTLYTASVTLDTSSPASHAFGAWLHVVSPGTIDLDHFAGPQLLLLELDAGYSGGDTTDSTVGKITTSLGGSDLIQEPCPNPGSPLDEGASLT